MGELLHHSSKRERSTLVLIDLDLILKFSILPAFEHWSPCEIGDCLRQQAGHEVSTMRPFSILLLRIVYEYTHEYVCKREHTHTHTYTHKKWWRKRDYSSLSSAITTRNYYRVPQTQLNLALYTCMLLHKSKRFSDCLTT